MKVIIPASYDPITLAHINLIERTLSFANHIYICVADNAQKNHLLTTEERVELIKEIFKDNKNIEVIKNIKPLVVDTAKELGVQVMVRGLRAVSDFEYELSLNQVNRTQSEEVETIFLMTDARYSFISSTMVRRLARVGGDLEKFVPKVVANKLKEKVNGK